MKHLLLVALLVGVTALSASTAQPDQPDTEVRAIIGKALERSAWAEEQVFEARYRHAKFERTRKFDKHGEVEEDEKRLFRVEPVRGVPYARLVSKNGGPIEGTDLNTEREKWHAFLEELDKDPDEQDEDEEDEDDIVFNDELLARYTAQLDGIRDLRGRPTYVISFEPRPGKLPVRRPIDRALNKSRGEVWVDQATYEIARVNFQLIERGAALGGAPGQHLGRHGKLRAGADSRGRLASHQDRRLLPRARAVSHHAAQRDDALE